MVFANRDLLNELSVTLYEFLDFLFVGLKVQNRVYFFGLQLSEAEVDFLNCFLDHRKHLVQVDSEVLRIVQIGIGGEILVVLHAILQIAQIVDRLFVFLNFFLEFPLQILLQKEFSVAESTVQLSELLIDHVH